MFMLCLVSTGDPLTEGGGDSAIGTSTNSAGLYHENARAHDRQLASKFRVSWTIGRTHCPMIIMLILQKERGVAANVLYTYVGPTYLDFVVAIIRYRYYFQINTSMYSHNDTH